MATYNDIIPGLSNGAGVPTGFDLIWDALNVTYTVSADAGAPGGKKLNIDHDGGTDRRNFLRYNGVNSDSNRANNQQLLLIRSNVTSGSGSSLGGVVTRGAGDGTSETGRAALLARNTTNYAIRHNTYTSGSAAITDNSGNGAWAAGNWQWLLVVTNSSNETISKTFALNDPALASELATLTNSTAASNGDDWLGFFSFDTDVDLDIGYYSIGTGSDSAPLPQAATLSAASGTQTGSTTANLTVSTTRANGTMYRVVTTSATPPSVAQVKAGQDHTGSAASFAGNASITASGAQASTATGLTASTTYYPYFVQTDNMGLDTTVAAGSSFTTASGTTYELAIDELLYSDDAKTTLITDTGYEAYVLDPSDNTLSKYFASVSITAGVVAITDALYETPTETFEIVLIKGNVRGVYPATVVSA